MSAGLTGRSLGIYDLSRMAAIGTACLFPAFSYTNMLRLDGTYGVLVCLLIERD